MKISRWKLIKAFKYRLLIELVYSCCYLPIIVAGVWFIVNIILRAIQGRNIYRILALDDNWWIYISLGGTWFIMIYFYYLYMERGLLFDILFLPVERQSEVLGSTIIYPAKTDTFDRDYASAYWVEINRGKKNKSLPLYVSKEFIEIPKGIKYNLYYLKHSKLIVDIEVLEGGGKKGKQIVEIPLMDAPLIPQYSKKELQEMTKIHRLPSVGLSVYCVAGLVGLVVWGICSWQNFSYWYRWEIGRCIGIWIFLLSLEIFFIVLFRKMDRGYLRDMHCKEIYVTDVIPIENIYGKKFWNRVDRKMRDRIRGIELEVTEGMHKNERFLLYKDISKYWNCFPMCASLPPRIRDRFKPGKQKMKAVRIYYLKHSKIVVKIDAVEINS